MSDTIIVSVRRDRNGFVIADARQREHHAADEQSLGHLIAMLTLDDALPKVVTEEHHDMVGLIAGLARRFVPGRADLVDAAEPMAHHVASLVKRNGASRTPRMKGAKR